MNFDSARQSKIEAKHSDRRSPAPIGQGEDEDRFDKVAASRNSQNLSGRSIVKLAPLRGQRLCALCDLCGRNLLCWVGMQKEINVHHRGHREHRGAGRARKNATFIVLSLFL